MIRLFLSVVFSLVATAALAQPPVPIQYRVTRTTPGQSPVITVIPKEWMQCGIPRGVLSSAGWNINDPADDALDCQHLTTTIFDGMAVGVPYTFTVAAQANPGDGWTKESDPVTVNYPNLPAIPKGLDLKLPPSATLVGNVIRRYQFFGLDTADVRLDIGGLLHVGAPAGLAVPGYDVRVGDRLLVSAWRP